MAIIYGGSDRKDGRGPLSEAFERDGEFYRDLARRITEESPLLSELRSSFLARARSKQERLRGELVTTFSADDAETWEDLT